MFTDVLIRNDRDMLIEKRFVRITVFIIYNTQIINESSSVILIK